MLERWVHRTVLDGSVASFGSAGIEIERLSWLRSRNGGHLGP